MDRKIEQALDTTLRRWETMSKAEHDEAESAANEFEASFYSFIDSVRQWFAGLEQRPQTLEEFLGSAMIKEIVALLPAPLYLNFETEAELIVENKLRIDDEKYD